MVVISPSTSSVQVPAIMAWNHTQSCIGGSSRPQGSVSSDGQ